jgi:negative regulator of sigma E activity
MNTEPSKPVTSQDLSAYFDGELPPEDAEAIALALAEDPQLRTEHAELGLLRGTVCAALEAEAQAVPAARFEQIWDEIDRAIERDARLQAEANRNASIWTRLWAALRPIRLPMLAAAAAATIAVLVVRPGSDEPNKPEDAPSVAEGSPPTPETAPAVAPTVEPDRLAVKEPSVPIAPPEPQSPIDTKLPPMPVPETSEAEIHGIEFGGKHGRISNTGTVTVLYVEEDETPTNSERSL